MNGLRRSRVGQVLTENIPIATRCSLGKLASGLLQDLFACADIHEDSPVLERAASSGKFPCLQPCVQMTNTVLDFDTSEPNSFQ